MLALRALLFDLDGTLAETAALNTAAYGAALAEVGIDVDHKRLELVVHGRHWRQFLPGLIESSGRTAEPGAIAERKKSIYAGTIGEVRLNVALLRLLEASHPAMKTALVTTASRNSVDALLDAHDLCRHFDVIVTGDDVAAHKPDPEAYLLAARRLDVPTECCLAFEDSDIGERSALAAGLDVVRVSIVMPAKN